DGEVPGGPYELIRLGHGSASARRLEPVPPSRRLSAAHKDRERELLAWVAVTTFEVVDHLYGPTLLSPRNIAPTCGPRAPPSHSPPLHSGLQSPIRAMSDTNSYTCSGDAAIGTVASPLVAPATEGTGNATTGVDAGLVQ